MIPLGHRKVIVACFGMLCLTVGSVWLEMLKADAASLGLFTGGVTGIVAYYFRVNVDTHKLKGE